MIPVLTAHTMRSCDRKTIEGLGIPSIVLMERASLALADAAEEMRNAAGGNGPVVAVCGPGNNGGDGICCARILHCKGIPSGICIADPEAAASPEFSEELAIADRCGVPRVALSELPTASVIVDAVFGIGLSRPVEEPYLSVIRAIRAASGNGAKILSADIPSGVHADTGRILGEAVCADVTVTMQHLKIGLLLPEGAAHAGEIRCADVGILTPEKPDCLTYPTDPSAMIAERIPKRDPFGNKGTFGKVIVAAGQPDMAGAAYFAASAVLRTGAGMVRILTHETNRGILQTMLPEAMLSTYRDSDEAEETLRGILPWADAAVLGPGIGCGPAAERMSAVLLEETDLPLVLDADGLNVCRGDLRALKNRTNTILTPHLGEMSRLTGDTVDAIRSDLPAAASFLARELGCGVLLKDARSIAVYADDTPVIIRNGNAGMATAGSGDVLAGILGGLLALGCEIRSAGAAGAALHAMAGCAAAARYGESALTASNILEEIGPVLRGIGR